MSDQIVFQNVHSVWDDLLYQDNIPLENFVYGPENQPQGEAHEDYL